MRRSISTFTSGLAGCPVVFHVPASREKPWRSFSTRHHQSLTAAFFNQQQLKRLIYNAQTSRPVRYHPSRVESPKDNIHPARQGVTECFTIYQTLTSTYVNIYRFDCVLDYSRPGEGATAPRGGRSRRPFGPTARHHVCTERCRGRRRISCELLWRGAGAIRGGCRCVCTSQYFILFTPNWRVSIGGARARDAGATWRNASQLRHGKSGAPPGPSSGSRCDNSIGHCLHVRPGPFVLPIELRPHWTYRGGELKPFRYELVSYLS